MKLRTSPPMQPGALKHGLLPSATAAAAFMVHQSRYLLTPDGSAVGDHGYLSFAPEVLTVLLALSTGWALRGALRGQVAHVPGPRSPVGRWALCTLALVSVFAGQELLEGHAHALVSAGGVSVVPIAAVWALALCWLAPRVSRAIQALASQLGSRTAPARRRSVLAFSHAAVQSRKPRGPVLAAGAAGRAPPLTLSS